MLVVVVVGVFVEGLLMMIGCDCAIVWRLELVWLLFDVTWVGV